MSTVAIKVAVVQSRGQVKRSKFKIASLRQQLKTLNKKLWKVR